MENAKKLLLVDPSRAIDRPTMSLKKLGSLDSEISDILNDEMPDDVKAKHYLKALHGYRYANQPAAPQSVRLNDDDDAILNTVQPESRIKAKRLLKHIKPTVRWSDDGELVADSELIPDSNIAELLGEASKKDSTDQPIGWVEFADALKETDTPDHFITNERLARYLRSKRRYRKRPKASPSTPKVIKKGSWKEYSS
jgi:hypothetical protein